MMRYPAAVLLLSFAMGNSAIAQNQPAPKPAPTPQPAPSAPPSEPSLDELLGLPAQPAPQPDPAAPNQPPTDLPSVPPIQPPTKPANTAADAARAELDRQLRAGQAADDFQQAVQLMGDAATRLTEARDAGIDTQRLQKDVLLRLDKLIADAEQNRQQSRSKKKKQQQSQQQQQNQQQQQQSSQTGQQQQANANASGGDVPRQDGSTNTPPPGNGAAWGSLPEHVRDALVQGLSDRYSARWQSLTESYYKKLAADPAQGSGSAPTPR